MIPLAILTLSVGYFFPIALLIGFIVLLLLVVLPIPGSPSLFPPNYTSDMRSLWLDLHHDRFIASIDRELADLEEFFDPDETYSPFKLFYRKRKKQLKNFIGFFRRSN